MSDVRIRIMAMFVIRKKSETVVNTKVVPILKIFCCDVL